MLQIKAYSKINLGYSLQKKRQDDYRNFSSIHLKSMLYDEIIIEPGNQLEIIYHNIHSTFLDKLIQKCIKVLKNYYILNKILAKITINKRIPINYGLGTRASIAVSLIKGLGDFLQLEIGYGDLNDISNIIHPELEYFNSELNATLILNGEVLNYLNINNPYYTLVIFPKVNYEFELINELLDEKSETANIEINKFDVFNQELILSQDMFLPNNVENHIIGKYNELKFLKNSLNDLAVFSSLNNKGSSLFAFYDDINKCKETLNKINPIIYYAECY